MSQRHIKKQKAKQHASAASPGKPTPRGLFQQAESFFQAVGVLQNPVKQGGVQFIVPSLVCEAFSLELYLKCLLVIQGKRYTATHDLEKLFDELDGVSKAKIEHISIPHLQATQTMMNHVHIAHNLGPAPKITFRAVLHESRNAFESFRYIHERSTSHGMASCYPIAISVREYVLDVRPEWRNFSFVTSPAPQPQTPTSPTP